MEDFPRTSLELLYTISRKLATSLDLNTTLSQVLHLSTQAVNAERGSLIVLDENQQPIDSAIVVNSKLIPHITDQMQPTLSNGLAGWVLKNRKGVLIADTRKDKRWLQREDDRKENSGGKSAVCVPLLSGERVAGILTLVHKTPGYFNLEHLTLLQSIADQAGVALHNAWLYDLLQAAHARYQVLFQDSIDPIFITNLDSSILEANLQAINTTGYALKSLHTKSMFNWNSSNPNMAILDSVPEERIANLQQDEIHSFESNLVKATGDRIPVQVYVRLVALGLDLQLQWIVRDISERKKFDRLQEDTFSMIYHDLRTPLANMVSAMDILHSMHLDTNHPEVTELVNILSRSTDRMQRLTSSLLDINYLEAGQSITRRKQESVLVIVKEAMQTVELNARSKSQTLAVDIGEDIPELFVDADMLKRVVINLLENSIKFTPKEGQITVRVHLTDGNVMFSVQDNGRGIPPESLKNIFEKFVSMSTESKSRGMGIGLAFCRLAVEAHGGKIWAESIVGEGSTFRFILPIALNQQPA